MMRSIFLVIVVLLSFRCDGQVKLYEANHPDIQITGRVDFSNPLVAKFWQPGVYVTARFSGSFCAALIEDENLFGKVYNYITIVVDNGKPKRIKLNQKNNTVNIGENLTSGEHTVVITKDTEAGTGFIAFKGFVCQQLLPSKEKHSRKLEFVGDSITTGTGSDASEIPCGKGEWHDQHNAYESYGPRVARALNADYHLSAVAGFGLIQSCCNLTKTLPQVFDNINMRRDTIRWNFSRYQPDVVTICLGENDGHQDSIAFTSAYVNFIKAVQSNYPKASIVCLNSPMADVKLNKTLKNYITGVVGSFEKGGDKSVSKFFFSKRFSNGCDEHPDVAEHVLMANELTAYLKNKFGW